jgi:hypothetical protein
MRCGRTPSGNVPPRTKLRANIWHRTGFVLPFSKRYLPGAVFELADIGYPAFRVLVKEGAVIRFPIFAMCFLMLARTGFCDVVELLNGDRITGTIESLVGNKLALSTTYAGRVFLDWRQVRTITTNDEYEVDLVGGQTITGEIIPSQPGEYRIGSAQGATTLATEIKGIRTPPETQMGFLSGWTAAADLGYSTTRGNSRATQWTIQLQPRRRTKQDSLKADLQSFRSTGNGDATNTQSLEARYDRFMSPRTFFFLVGKAEHDQRESLLLRLREGAGLGYRMTAGTKTQISALMGFTVVQERFKGLDYNMGGEGLFGYELETRAISQLQITSKGQILPSYADLGRFRSEWDSGVRVPFRAGFNFGIRLFHRYDSEPPAGARKSDYGLLSTIGATF